MKVIRDASKELHNMMQQYHEGLGLEKKMKAQQAII